jgi:hypothetical protein
MTLHSLSVIGLTTCLVASACQRPPHTAADAPQPTARPLALIVEKVIEGEVYGKRLSRPFGIAVSAAGPTFVADQGNNRLLLCSADLTPVADAGGLGSDVGLFNELSFITMDGTLSLLLSDEGNRRVCLYNNRLAYVSQIDFYDEEDPLKFGRPSGLALTDYGETWIADRINNRIAVFDNLGQFDRFVGDFGYSGEQLTSPEKIIAGRDDEFVVCDAGGGRLVKYDLFGSFVGEVILESLDYPIAATLLGDQLWVLDGGKGGLVCLDPKGRELAHLGPALVGVDGDLKEPSDVAALADGRLVISDTGNNRLLVCRVISEEL